MKILNMHKFGPLHVIFESAEALTFICFVHINECPLRFITFSSHSEGFQPSAEQGGMEGPP